MKHGLLVVVAMVVVLIGYVFLTSLQNTPEQPIQHTSIIPNEQSALTNTLPEGPGSASDSELFAVTEPEPPPASLLQPTPELEPGLQAEDEPHPTLFSITPTHGPRGTIVTLTGENLAGFEGDLVAWIEHADGRAAYLMPYGTSTYPHTDTITVQIPDSACTTNNMYSGLSCRALMPLEPGEYHIYTAPWGRMSNKLTFTIDGTMCSGLTPGLCNQTPECTPHYGPSSCDSEGNCTTDESYIGCTSLSPSALEEARMDEALVPELGTKYIHGHDWPPYYVRDSLGTFSCPVGDGYVGGGLPSVTEPTTINAQEYCVTRVSEGAAGSSYSTYTYTTEKDEALYKVWFTLRSINCGGYATSEDMQSCIDERDQFSVDKYAAGLLLNIWNEQ